MRKYVNLLIFSILILCSYTPPQKTWLALGDSITYLNDHPNETGNRITKGYMSLITNKHKHISYTNKGYNGWTVIQIATQIEKLNLVKADIYSVFLGTNDWWHGNQLGNINDYTNNTGLSTVCGAYRVIVDKLKSLNPDAQIILITPMQRGDFVYINNQKNNAYGSYKAKNNQELSQFAEAIAAIGKQEHFEVANLYQNKKLSQKTMVKFKRVINPNTGLYQNYKYPDFIDLPFDPSKDEYPYPTEAIANTYDGLHPSDKGYKIIAKQLDKLIK